MLQNKFKIIFSISNITTCMNDLKIGKEINQKVLWQVRLT
jgi:hypothetical protein